ncbi:MAG: tetratricopeptide repeat protein [Mariprofundales bacterium]|nr:tetratricopeptide repeat protein [Mariprofundales bacterium]
MQQLSIAGYRATILTVMALLLLHPAQLWAVQGKTDQTVKRVQTLIQHGYPEKAVAAAKKALSQQKITTTTRFQLLSLIADAEYIRASAGFFDNINAALEANKALLQEFPQRTDGARIRWRVVKLYWRHKQIDAALAASQQLRSIHGKSREAHKSWLVDAQIHYHLGRYSKARSALLQFSLQSSSKKEQAQQLAWTAMIDIKEERFKQALDEFDRSFKIDKNIISSTPDLFAEYIMLLSKLNHTGRALQYADDFLASYSETPLRPKVRLIRADMLAKNPAKVEEAIREYMNLSEEHAASTLGRQAFMRKVMLQLKSRDDFHSLKPALVAFKRLARHNQMSIIEDEATLDQATLWARLAHSKAKDVPPGSIDAALENFAKAAAGTDPAIRQEAIKRGEAVFEQYLNTLLDKKLFLQAVALWKRYPNMRNRVSDQTKFGIAHAMRLLTQYDQAERLLHDLYQRHKGTLRGQQIKLEQARLWLDNKNPKGIDKINRWLSEHEFTIYRPEMLLLVAQMQLADKRFDAAFQTIVQISPDDLIHALRSDYWKLRANIAEARKRWHVAAHAWQQFGLNDSDNKPLALRRRALALFKAEDYAAAEPLWLRIPESDQDASWRYYLNMSRYHNGKWQQALKELRLLSEDNKAGIYSALASLALAEHNANEILKERP